MTASQDTATALQAAVDAIKAEQLVCGGSQLDLCLAAVTLAQGIFVSHEHDEDHIA